MRRGQHEQGEVAIHVAKVHATVCSSANDLYMCCKHVIQSHMLVWPCLDQGADSFSINAKAEAATADRVDNAVAAVLSKIKPGKSAHTP